MEGYETGKTLASTIIMAIEASIVAKTLPESTLISRSLVIMHEHVVETITSKDEASFGRACVAIALLNKVNILGKYTYELKDNN